MTENQPNTTKVPTAKSAPKRFLVLNERTMPKAARIVTNAKMITVPIRLSPFV